MMSKRCCFKEIPGLPGSPGSNGATGENGATGATGATGSASLIPDPFNTLFVAVSWSEPVNPLTHFTTVTAAAIRATALNPTSDFPVEILIYPGSYNSEANPISLPNDVYLNGISDSPVILPTNIRWIATADTGTLNGTAITLQNIQFNNLTVNTTANSLLHQNVVCINSCRMGNVTITFNKNRPRFRGNFTDQLQFINSATNFGIGPTINVTDGNVFVSGSSISDLQPTTSAPFTSPPQGIVEIYGSSVPNLTISNFNLTSGGSVYQTIISDSNNAVITGSSLQLVSISDTFGTPFSSKIDITKSTYPLSNVPTIVSPAVLDCDLLITAFIISGSTTVPATNYSFSDNNYIINFMQTDGLAINPPLVTSITNTTATVQNNGTSDIYSLFVKKLGSSIMPNVLGLV